MAISFKDTAGAAKKSNVEYYKFVDGDNVFRMFGDILPRYVYWKNNVSNGKALSVECLSFDRDQEKFTNVEKDWFQHYFPDDKCAWSYLVQIIDPKDGKVKMLGLKKKMFEAIMALAEDLGDPTDIDTGWSVNVKRVKTGSANWNVEYQLREIRCKNSPLSDEEKELVANAKGIDDLMPRPTPEDQHEFIKRNYLAEEEEITETADEETLAEFDDDVPM